MGCFRAEVAFAEEEIWGWIAEAEVEGEAGEGDERGGMLWARSFTPSRGLWMHLLSASSRTVMGRVGSIRFWSIQDWIRSRFMGAKSAEKLVYLLAFCIWVYIESNWCQEREEAYIFLNPLGP